MIDKVVLEGERPIAAWVCSNCGSDHVTETKDLILGGDAGNADGYNPDVIYLPMCSCGTRTFLLRTWDSLEVADQPVRRAINSLAEHLKEVGRSHPAAKARHEEEEGAAEVPAGGHGDRRHHRSEGNRGTRTRGAGQSGGGTERPSGGAFRDPPAGRPGRAGAAVASYPRVMVGPSLLWAPLHRSWIVVRVPLFP